MNLLFTFEGLPRFSARVHDRRMNSDLDRVRLIIEWGQLSVWMLDHPVGQQHLLIDYLLWEFLENGTFPLI